MTDPLTMKGDTSWFTESRFGLFIHWGLYAMGARHEWLQDREGIPPDVYEERYFPRFDPDLYDPEAWADMAAACGMKYFVITTKHHEGFCLWDSKHTDYKAPNTPAGRDLLRPMVEAFRKRGIRVGFYYSLIDWHHPDFTIDPHIGPFKNAENRDELNKGRDQLRYAAYMYQQVEELLTEFGDIDILWFDFSYPRDGTGKGKDDWQSEKLVEMIRRLQPKVILDDRLDLPGVGDIHTPEQFQPQQQILVDGKPVVWEGCQTLSGSWGYHRDESTWRDTGELIRTLIDSVAMGGNLLLNVGPTARGEWDHRAQERMQGIADWMRHHGRSIHGCGAPPADIPQPRDGRFTYDATNKRLYAHCFAWPYKNWTLPIDRERVAYVQLLHDASEIPMMGLEPWQENWAEQAGFDAKQLILRIPETPPSVTVPVFEIFLKD